MSVETKGGGITQLSALTIDADKDWAAKGISNIKELALGMVQGDILVRGAGVIVRIPASVANMVLTSTGVLSLPVWAPGGTYYNRFFPVTISLTDAEVIVAIAQWIAKNAALATSHFEAYDDQPASMVKQLTPALASVDAENVIAAADHSIAKNEPLKSGLSILCDGFVEETAAGVQTDHTAQAREATANDLNLCPMSDTVLDKIYIGSNYKFWQAQLQIDTNGAGNWTNVAYYWNGAWTACVDENDGSNDFQQGTGLKFISHTPQADWALSVIQGKNLYWMMIRTDNWVNRATKPLGSQVWVAIA